MGASELVPDRAIDGFGNEVVYHYERVFGNASNGKVTGVQGEPTDRGDVARAALDSQ